LAVTGCSRPNPPSEPRDQSAAALMRAAVDARDWPLAERYSKQALIEDPDDPDLITTAAGIAAFGDRKREAASMLVDAARLANYQPKSRVDIAIRGLIEVGEVYGAIELLEASLQQHPDRDDHRQILVGFWNEVQRTDKIGVHLQKLIEHRHFNLALLISTTETSSRRLSEKTSLKLQRLNADDYRVRLADAFLFLYRRNVAGAAEVLEEILNHHPDFAPAHAMYGQVLATSARWSELPQWLEQAPPDSRDFADHWLTLGDYALTRRQSAPAVRAFWEATRCDPNRSLAWDRLSLAAHQLRQSKSPHASRISDTQLHAITDHGDHLLAVRDSFNDFTGNAPESQTAATRVARELLVAGRVWEAEAWSALATTLEREPDSQLATLREQIVKKLRRDSSWFARETPALAIDFSFLPLPRIEADPGNPANNLVIPAVTSHDHIHMTERSEQWGLHSIGDGNDPSDPRLAPLIRSTGVGGGAIDYDLDGLPDIVVMNAGGTMLKSDSQANELMRNVGATFVRVSDAAGVNGTRYGQGVAVGDFNEDGFADLFLANLGKNRLLRNNGDGTFTDCSEQLDGAISDQWSTSAAFVDVNGDAIADLIVTRYCRAVHHLDQACANKQGVPGPCHPMTFPADVDQFFAGTSDGRLVDMTAAWIGQPVAGRGLGIVTGTLDNRQLGIFVANDMTRNSYYSLADDRHTKLIDSASARGVAVDGRSLAQASMGIAASDFDHDGDLDMYVTGFGREYNVYYEQIVPGVWKDETAKLNLIDPTLALVGFGTQAVDLDNDGIDEIVVTNGNIGQFSEPGADRYEQPLQLFRRTRDGTFALLEDDAWGDYFSDHHVGRALWTTDVNRDGRMDVIVTHTREQIGLLINETSGQNNRVAFKLVATQCSRDAIGAVIRFHVNGQSRTLWMLSGDGYFCSNEKTLLAGLDEASEVTDVTVTWQDGSVDEISTLEANSQYLIVQGEGEAFPLYRYPVWNTSAAKQRIVE
jgi:tetratricopeptide (TPR) repeat protein